MDNLHLVPVNIVDIGNSIQPENKLLNTSQKLYAESRILAIIEYCQIALARSKTTKRVK